MQPPNTLDSQQAGTSLAPVPPQVPTRNTNSTVGVTTNTGKRLTIGRKLKTALDLMVYGPDDGEQAGLALAIDEAAKAAGMTTRQLRLAIDRPHVRQYLNQQKQVFRAAASAQNISFAVQMRSTAKNEMARLGAMKFIEADEQQNQRQSSAPTPGITIVIAGENARAAVQVNHTQSGELVSPHDDEADR